MNKFHVSLWFLLPVLATVTVRSEASAPLRESPLSLEFAVAASEGVSLEESGVSTGKMRGREYAMELEYKRRLSGTRPRILKFALELQREEFSGLATGSIHPDTLVSAGLEASLTTVHNARWLSYASLSAGWHSAGADNEPQSSGFGVQAVAFGRYSVNEWLHIAFGAHADSLAEGSDRVNPVLGVEWLPAPRWRLSLGVPKTGLFYEVSDVLAIGLQADLKSDTYAISDDFRLRHGLPADVKMEYFDVRAGLQIHWRFHPQASLTLSAGTVLTREFEFEEANFRRRLKTDGTGGGYGSLGCIFKF